MKADFGMIGLGVMGENLALNVEKRGFRVAVFNRTLEKTERFLAERGAGKGFVGCRTLEELCSVSNRPRRIMMLVRAGEAVDDLIERLLPLLEEGDVLIDGGNSHYLDTMRRSRLLEGKGLLYVGAGVSGGEEGALCGPSLMPGGSEAAWEIIRPVFLKIAAKTPNGEPCCAWMGPAGAGHFVKMVHNGIEYADMQLIAETYHLMHEGLGLTHAEMRDAFAEWNRGELDSYLVEITADLLAHVDADGKPTVESILDVAGQKGTGRWTAATALELARPLPSISEAVFARFLSALKEERALAAEELAGPGEGIAADATLLEDLRKALYAAKIVSYAQGFQLMRAASNAYDWDLDYGGIALTWRGGCIIRSAFLDRIKEAFDADRDLPNLLLAPFFRRALSDAQSAWRRIVAVSARSGIPMPAAFSALAYYDGYRSARLPANLIQAQRDYFGAHTYERIDRPRGEFFHTDWTGGRGEVPSGTC